MGTPGPASNGAPEDALGVFAQLERPCTPLTTDEIAAELDCTRQIARRKLGELAERGALVSRRIDARSRVWWRPMDALDRRDAAGRAGDAGVPAGSGSEGATPEQFREFVRAVEDYAIFTLDADGVVSSWNEGAARIKGYDGDEVVGKHVSAFYTEEDLERGVPEENLRTAAAEGRVEDEGWRVRKDGTRFRADVVITAVHDDDGSLRGFTKVTRDLTQRREYERSLEAERGLLDRVLDASQVGIIITDADGEASLVNDAAGEILGIPSREDREAYTPGTRQIYGEDGRPLPTEAHPFARVLETGEPVYDEVLQLERPDGTRRWLSVNAVPLTNGDGEVERVVSTGDDVTELKERARELETELSEVLGRISDAFYALDEEWRFTHVNDRAAETLRRDADELLGESIWDEFPEAADGRIREQYRRAMDAQEPVSFELFLETLDGWFELNAYPSETGLSVYFQDVTERKRRERALAESEQRYRTLAENFPNGAVVMVDGELRLTLAEGRAFEDRDVESAEMEGLTLREAYGDGTADAIEPAYRAALEGERGRIEVTYADREWVVHTAPIRDAGGEVFAAMGMSQDVTERKRRERELERYRTIVETVEDGVYVVDSDGEFTMVNEAYAEMTGYPREELIGADVTKVVDRETAEAARETYGNLPSGERETMRLEADVHTADGGTLAAEATFANLPDEGDEYDRIGVVRDVSERKAYERELEESERRYRTLAENFPDGVVALFDEEFRYTAAGGELVDALGIETDEVVGSTIRDRYPDDLLAEVEPHFHGALEGKTASFEVDYRGRHLSAYTLPVRNAEDEPYAGMLVVRDVTDRVEREREIEEQRERYRRLVDVAPVPIVTYDADGDVGFANPATAELAGVDDPEELHGRSAVEFIHPEEREEAARRIRQMLEDREPVRPNETRLVTADGAVKHVLVTSLPITDDGEPAAQTVLVDITERKEREQALERYETVFATVDDGVFVLDSEFRFAEVNDAYAEMAGRSKAELAGEHCSLTVGEEVSSVVADLTGELAGGGRGSATLEADVLTAGGGRVPAESKFTVLPSDGDGFRGSVGVVRDLTERKAYERELETRARQQDVVAEFGQRALGSPSVDDLFDEAVRAVADTLGTDCAAICERRADDELLVRSGVGLREGVVGEATVEVDPDSQAGFTLDSTTPVVVEDLATESRFDGPALPTDHDVSAGISTVVGPPDDPWGVLGTHDADRREFTPNEVSFVRSVANVLTTAIERTEYEERLNETVEELRTSNERLEQFAYIASHDLQEPLRMVSSYLQLLERRYRDELDDDAREFIDYAVDGAERMREMIDDLLSYSRVDTKAEPFEPTDSGAVFDRVLGGLRLKIEEEDAEVVRGDLPTVTADDKQLEQVFQNLVSNALKYRGEEPPRIEVDAERRDGAWRFRVSDNGIGIDPVQADRIFDVFDRLHTREEYPGTGIGLALCERIVERHGGRIWVESTVGEGSCFYFTIPYDGGDDR
ncbi:PAS domain-containing sensor histidine kinase [Halorarum salinum]|uniref:histidine kinase n=1 Tax=Halorarum salinum TaxID=2743089 RepID=A0A7D5Q8G5_9EURY|nr:PAS domain S-box protein [Halobaculum salinum]QLG60957.1 PAS domain S-box protein [Halobaculum salinum]